MSITHAGDIVTQKDVALTLAVPLFNRGTHKDIVSIELMGGTHIQGRGGSIAKIADAEINSTTFSEEYSPLVLSTGFLCHTFESAGFQSDSVARAHRQLINARFAIDLSGGGSWDEAMGSSPQRPVYIVHEDAGAIGRMGWFPTWHGPSYCNRKKAWTESLLQDASSVLSHLMDGTLHSRVRRAGQIRMDSLVMSPEQCLGRYLLSITALETLFISPKERTYIWKDSIQERIRSVLGDHPWCSRDVFTRICSIRNDASHRGGVTRHGDPTTRSCCEWSAPDEILYRALRWAILKRDHAGRAFDFDDWSLYD
jgi:hypothetical protein